MPQQIPAILETVKFYLFAMFENIKKGNAWEKTYLLAYKAATDMEEMLITPAKALPYTNEEFVKEWLKYLLACMEHNRPIVPVQQNEQLAQLHNHFQSDVKGAISLLKKAIRQGRTDFDWLISDGNYERTLNAEKQRTNEAKQNQNKGNEILTQLKKQGITAPDLSLRKKNLEEKYKELVEHYALFPLEPIAQALRYTSVHSVENYKVILETINNDTLSTLSNVDNTFRAKWEKFMGKTYFKLILKS